MLRIVLADDTTEQRFPLALVLERLGCTLVAKRRGHGKLHTDTLRLAPDVVVVATRSPSSVAFAQISTITQSCPRPVVLFTNDPARELIRQAVRAGVSAYVVGDRSPESIAPILDAAIARFDALQGMRAELDSVKTQLAERKVVERAKGILMKTRSLSEEDAYRALRKQAMERNQKLSEVALQVIAVADLLR